ncbi:MAG: type IV pilus secretin PilQ, partial [Thermodesulfobacteriota bacterium]|nr:type IV pilus secretin PilQ [Thermodesulfobacteriota bacterium]
MKKQVMLILLIVIMVLPSYVLALNIQSVEFMNVNNKSRLQIGLDSQAQYDVIREDNHVILRVQDANLPKRLERPFTTKAFRSAVNEIMPTQSGKDAIFEISMKVMTPYFVSQDKDLLIMDFDIPEDMVKPAAKKPAPKLAVQTAVKKAVPVAVRTTGPSIMMSKRAQDLSTSMVEPTEEKKYTGKHISLDFQKADIHNVIRIISDVSDLNIITSDEVKGKITVKLKDIPWDQALDVVLASKDLDKMRVNNVIRIAPASKIKAAKEMILSSKKTQEKLEPLVTSVIPVNFANASDISKVLAGKTVGMVSNRGSITAEDRTNVLIIKDIKKNVDSLYSMIKRLDKATPQVLIRARIVQADDSFARGLGVQWGGAFQNQSNSTSFGLTGNQTGSPNNLFSSTMTGNSPTWSTSVIPSPAMAVNFPQSQAAGIGITLGRLAGSMLDLDLRLDIGESTGTTNVIARPRIVTLDNKKAVIRQGEKYPYVVRDENGQLSTELKDIELVLEVTPRIAFDGSINMEISVKRNAIGSTTNSLGDPSIASR